MMWLRRIATVPLLLLAFICAIGLVKALRHRIDDPVGTAVFCTIIVLGTLGGTYFLLRPDIERWRALTFAQFRHWVYTNPLGQALALYVVAVPLMAVYPEGQVVPGVLAACVYSVAAPWSAALQQRWWAYAGLALLGFCLLFFLLAGTAEGFGPRGFGEGGMLFLLPMEGFPILLVVSGIVRLFRGARARQEQAAPDASRPADQAQP
jgi:hypothetical protein